MNSEVIFITVCWSTLPCIASLINIWKSMHFMENIYLEISEHVKKCDGDRIVEYRFPKNQLVKHRIWIAHKCGKNRRHLKKQAQPSI